VFSLERGLLIINTSLPWLLGLSHLWLLLLLVALLRTYPALLCLLLQTATLPHGLALVLESFPRQIQTDSGCCYLQTVGNLTILILVFVVHKPARNNNPVTLVQIISNRFGKPVKTRHPNPCSIYHFPLASSLVLPRIRVGNTEGTHRFPRLRKPQFWVAAKVAAE
jgi:hypothetical protein